MDMNSTHHSFPLVVPSTPRPRIAQKPQPVMEKPEESERFRMRRMRIRQYEREQALEDKAAVIMIQQHRDSLLQQFAAVKTEFSDLDGLSWADPQAQRLLAHWHVSTKATHYPQSRITAQNENEVPFDGLPISFSSPCQLEGLGSVPPNSILVTPSHYYKHAASAARDPASNATRSALATMSSSPQLAYYPPDLSSLDLPTPTLENPYTTLALPVPQANNMAIGSFPSPSNVVMPGDLRMQRSAASMGKGSLLLEDNGVAFNAETVRKKPTGPRHVA